MKRGEIWWAELPAPVGSRPVVILTRDSVLPSISAIVVALVTRTVRQLPTEVLLGRRQGLPARCVANLDNILTVPRPRLWATALAALKRGARAAADDGAPTLYAALFDRPGRSNGKASRSKPEPVPPPAPPTPNAA